MYLTEYLFAHVKHPCSKIQFFILAFIIPPLNWNFFLSIGNWYLLLCSSHQNITIYWIHIKLAFMASRVRGSKLEFLYLKYLYFPQIGYLANPSRPQRYSILQKTEYSCQWSTTGVSLLQWNLVELLSRVMMSIYFEMILKLHAWFSSRLLFWLSMSLGIVWPLVLKPLPIKKNGIFDFYFYVLVENLRGKVLTFY